jgi:hypothetical protein
MNHCALMKVNQEEVGAVDQTKTEMGLSPQQPNLKWMMSPDSNQRKKISKLLIVRQNHEISCSTHCPPFSRSSSRLSCNDLLFDFVIKSTMGDYLHWHREYDVRSGHPCSFSSRVLDER